MRKCFKFSTLIERKMLIEIAGKQWRKASARNDILRWKFSFFPR